MLVVSINVAGQGAMRHYTHLSAEQRDRIAELHAEGKAVSDIGRDSSALSCKLKRNGRHTRCKPHKRLSGPALAEEVREHGRAVVARAHRQKALS